jgi:hypothetical protein
VTALAASSRTHLVGCGWFWVWTAVGAAATLAFLSFGVILALPVLVLAGVMLSRPRIRASSFGLLTGVGSGLLVIAWINRHGPFNPVSWLVAGLVLFVTGIVAHASLRD